VAWDWPPKLLSPAPAKLSITYAPTHNAAPRIASSAQGKHIHLLSRCTISSPRRT
jgi:hypothetical protein